uniref:phospholipase A2 n=2 Tax=Gouania willdenowi TaxID=441366 RepID=A0A8C5HXC3_GOUWI
MRRSCLLQLVLVISALVSVEPQDMNGPFSHHILCFTSSFADGQTRTTVLLEDSAGLRSLFFALWSEDIQLLSCRVNTDPLVTEDYHTFCNIHDTQSEGFTRKFNVRALVAPDAPCAHVSNSGTGGRSRRKRAWIFPGTLWCGSGSKAIGYEELGMFESADRCCREHDHCLHIIPAFTFNYGVFNSKFYTVSHCECDQRFRECLLSVNDSISSMVGYSFFNILQVPCFELKPRKRCTVMYWWGMCKTAKVAPYAIFKDSLPFNTSDVKSTSPDISHSSTPGIPQNDVTTVSPKRKAPEIKHTCVSRDPPRGDTFQGRLAKERRCKKHQLLLEEASSQMAPTSPTPTTTVALILNASKSHFLMSKRNTTKKETTNSLLDYLPRSSPSSTTQPNISSAPQRNIVQHLATTAVPQTKTTQKNIPTPGNLCCRSRKPARGDTFQPLCQSCLEQDTGTLNAPAATAAAATPLISTNLTTIQHFHLSNISAITIKTNKLKTTSKRPQKQVETSQTWRNTSHEPMGSDPSHSTRAEGSHQANYPSRNKTDDLCGSLRYLDACKFTIPSLKKKHELQNLDSKTAYHCNCTSRLAVLIESMEKPGILPSLLMEFVSQLCFMLPEERMCPNRESCPPGFTEASDLHRALKKIEKKETAWVQISSSGRKRGNPVRLYKRCLRLQMEVDFMA